VHHRDGNRQNIRESNLVVLCVDCHSRQPRHEHLRIPRADRLAINRLRRAQRLHPDRGGWRDRWREAERFADPATLDMLRWLRRREEQPPEVGFEVLLDQTGVRADLAWPQERRLCFIRQPDEQTLHRLSDDGWSVTTPKALLG